MAPIVPSDEQVIHAVFVLRRAHEGIGRAQMLGRLQWGNNSQLSEARLKKLVPPVNATPKYAKELSHRDPEIEALLDDT